MLARDRRAGRHEGKGKVSLRACSYSLRRLRMQELGKAHTQARDRNGRTNSKNRLTILLFQSLEMVPKNTIISS